MRGGDVEDKVENELDVKWRITVHNCQINEWILADILQEMH
jgi:hypothetical protein